MPQLAAGHYPQLPELLQHVSAGSGTVLLDGNSTRSWGCGRAAFSAFPLASLEVYPTGWGRHRQGKHTWWEHGPPLRQWQEFLNRASPESFDDPDAVRVVSVLAYDLKDWIERLPRCNRPPREPILYAALYDWRLEHDYRTGKRWLFTQTGKEPPLRADSLPVCPETQTTSERISARPLLDRGAYCQIVTRVLDFIAAGDIYQANIAQPFVGEPFFDSKRLFNAWCRRYAMPYAAYVDGGSWTIVSNSPECFLTKTDRNVSTFPIKGTRRATHSHGFAMDPKERAEHVMIVDLERNDLGRVCEIGSVRVEYMARVEEFPGLQHLVAQVCGLLEKHTTLADLIGATFPGGSITGAPKIRAMQIIEELEPMARGFYTGAIGWTDLRGQGTFSLLIRTAVVNSGRVTFWTGGGIVADSDPEREYEETLLKAETFLAALRNC